MTEHILKQLLAKVGVTHPGEERAQMNEMLPTQIAEIQSQYDRGLISRNVGLDAMRHVMAAALDEVVNDPVLYRQARESGQLDAARAAIGGWNDDISPEAAAEQRKQAFNVALGHRADAMFAAGQCDPASYAWLAERIDPGAMSHARNFAGLNQPAPGDLDETPRPLDADETNTVAALAYGSRHGMVADKPQQQSNERAEPVESASDWSQDRLEKFFETRNDNNNKE